jgi:hypothetical protein
MAGIDITVDEALLPGLLSGDGTSVAKLMEWSWSWSWS